MIIRRLNQDGEQAYAIHIVGPVEVDTTGEQRRFFASEDSYFLNKGKKIPQAVTNHNCQMVTVIE